jgi:hypothetical protein
MNGIDYQFFLRKMPSFLLVRSCTLAAKDCFANKALQVSAGNPRNLVTILTF